MMVGSPVRWAFIRLGQIVFSVGVTCAIFVLWYSGEPRELVAMFTGFMVFFLLGLQLYLRALAFGAMTDTGLRFRRYFRTFTVGWNEIVEIEYVYAGLCNLRLKLRGRVGASRFVCFSMDPLFGQSASLGEALRYATGKVEPTVVGILRTRICDAHRDTRGFEQ